MSNIRVTYSGLIAFVVGIIGVFTGLIFVLMVTRRLSPEEFGTWALIGSIVHYFMISELIISYWSTRQIARNEQVGKTAILSSAFFSLGAIPIYLIYVLLITEKSTANFEIMLLGTILLPIFFVSQSLAAINLGHKPHATSYSLVLFETLKIPFGLFLVVILELGVEGAIFAIFFAYVGRIIVQFYFAKPKLGDMFKRSILKRWLHMSWIPLYSNIPRYIQTLDVVLYSIITGSVLGIAFYHAAITVSGIVTHSSSISQALYPKLLAERNFEGIKKNLTHVMFFAVPLLGISVIFSKPALFALNPLYQDAWLIVILLSFKMFAYILKTVPGAILGGTEQVDTEKNPTFSRLMASNLFQVPTILSIFSAIYLGTLIVVLILLPNSNGNELELVTWWALIGLIIEIPSTIALWIKSKKHAKFSFPFKNTSKYIGATLVFIVIFYFTSPFIITYEESIYKFLPALILQLSICVGIYLMITFTIDTEVKILFKTIFHEFSKKK